MIDIHCHILPGIDDGPKDLKDSLLMAKEAVAEGITSIIATPHFNQKYENSKEMILAKVKQLNEVLEQENIPLTILPGQEPRIYGELLDDYEIGRILTLNKTGKYLFIELPSGHVPRYTEQLLYDIQMKEMTPIIVHPERNQEIIENPDVLYKLVEKGALTQITASSLSGDLGKKIKKFSIQLIESSLTHFIASDAHNVSSRNFRLASAYHEMEKQFGMQAVFTFSENAELLVEGKSVYRAAPERVRKSKFLGIF
ncbi:tyrosine-protein phosphatase [Bacillus suaedaesalsae]|uniref:Tyrosine-protein phosphatase n=1 Tax=Bacillus suaedaesalsae TaxID=2810349 RepID=A0ABS2DKS6_9BACI|nr:CpsB/CapC family capsule biosynthesis tyrosine phosphatase [Bacillus suaedaesalsae]MBM6619104.1 tyrosine protein phosphatase [Bacillus suaedaesalsae]